MFLGANPKIQNFGKTGISQNGNSVSVNGVSPGTLVLPYGLTNSAYNISITDNTSYSRSTSGYYSVIGNFIAGNNIITTGSANNNILFWGGCDQQNSTNPKTLTISGYGNIVLASDTGSNSNTTISGAHNIILGGPSFTSHSNSSCVALGYAIGSLGNLSVAIGNTTFTSAGGVAIGSHASAANSTNGVALGYYANGANLNGSIALGYYATTTSKGEFAINTGNWSDGSGYGTGVSFQSFQIQTTNATATEMLVPEGSDTNAPSSYIILPTYSSNYFEVTIVGRVPGTTDRCVFTGSFLISRESTAASTVLDYSTGFTQKYATAALSSSSIAVTADTTNGRPAIKVTGVAATTIRWTGNARITRSRTAT